MANQQLFQFLLRRVHGYAKLEKQHFRMFRSGVSFFEYFTPKLRRKIPERFF
jgi:hypothetical protein